MVLQKPDNPNYCATVVTISNIIPLPNCDNLVATNIFGFQAIVSKDITVGTMGIFFPVETQLSEEYCKENNLFRHEEYNRDHMQKGYLEDNRRIRAIKFRGNTSNALFMPLQSVEFALADKKTMQVLHEGDTFDYVDGVKICEKYLVPRRGGEMRAQEPRQRRVDSIYFPEHFSTDNYFRNAETIPKETYVIVTQKLHGTSIRVANTLVNRKLTLKDRIAGFFGANIKKTEYSYVFGSRKVLKDPNNTDQKHYYDTDIWTNEGKKLEGLIPENFMVFGELVGWTADGKAIQTDYTYGLPKGLCRLYVYRVAFINERGLITDLSWNQVEEFCRVRNLDTVPVLGYMTHNDFDVTRYLDTRFGDVYEQALNVQDGMVDEGVCIRIEALTPKIYKAKSPLFFEHETKLLDKGEVDLETEGSTI